MLVIVGSGRSGTKSLAEAFGGHHEPYSEVFLPVAAAQISVERKAEFLAHQTDYDDDVAVAHYRLSELVLPMAMAFPQARFLHVIREEEACVASMVSKGWYDPRHDGNWPLSFSYWRWEDFGLYYDINHEGYRSTAPIIDGTPWREWREWSQERRCRWWYRYSNGLVYSQRRLVPMVTASLERLTAEDCERIAEWAGVPFVRWPIRSNMG